MRRNFLLFCILVLSGICLLIVDGMLIRNPALSNVYADWGRYALFGVWIIIGNLVWFKGGGTLW